MTAATAPSDAESRESDRTQHLDELLAEHGQELESRFGPGTFGCHELLDRTQLIARLVDELGEHPACVRDAEWHRLATQAADALHELYQKVGAAHL